MNDAEVLAAERRRATSEGFREIKLIVTTYVCFVCKCRDEVRQYVPIDAVDRYGPLPAGWGLAVEADGQEHPRCSEHRILI
jgi:hypothetical protein